MGSGFKTFTAGAVLTASDVNNYLMEQGVMYFATTTARDTAITSPEDGMVAYIGSNDSSEGLYTYNGTAWRKGPGWNAPWGFIASASRTTDVTVNTGTSDITGATVTFTAVSNRYYKIFGKTLMDSNHGASQSIDFRITVDGTAVLIQPNMLFANPGPGDQMQFNGTIVQTLSAGSHTAKLQGTFSAGGSNTFRSPSDNPSFILVEDIGPAGAPA